MYFWESFWCVSEEICYLRTSLPSLPVSFFLFLSAVLLTVSIDYINTRPLYFPFSNLVLLVKRSQVSHTHTHTYTHAQTRDGNFSNKPRGWGGGHLFPSTASFLLHSVPPAMPGVKGKWEENRRSAFILPHKHITGPLEPVWGLSEAGCPLCTDMPIQQPGRLWL